MTPEQAIAEVVALVFPGSSCTTWLEADKQYVHFQFRLVAGERIYGLDHVLPQELVDAHPDAAAREVVLRVKNDMRDVMADNKDFKSFTSPLSGMPMGPTGFTKDGWYDTDKRRRDDQRLLELARLETERQETEKAKMSILDTIAQRALREA